MPADDVLAALTRLDEVRTALETLKRDLTRAARARRASWQQVADDLGPDSRSSAESRFVRLERDAAGCRGDRCPERQRAERSAYGCTRWITYQELAQRYSSPCSVRHSRASM
ncbi:hypothetical protein [Streptomyces sp. NPDC057496]|uniref:hypothetical protein n=1 Tax=Streptomyces sp. NPDC057496 TaxID=3346149 RepID=UPI0036AD2B28